jgi:hypothetical protein
MRMMWTQAVAAAVGRLLTTPLGVVGTLSLFPLFFALPVHADNVPWQVPSAPARFIVDLDKPDQPGKVSSVRIGLPDPHWAERPVYGFDEKGNAIGAKFLWSTPGEMSTVVFDSSAGGKRFFLYFGSPAITPAAPIAPATSTNSSSPSWPPASTPAPSPSPVANWTPEAGVILETRPGDGKEIQKLEQMQEAWKKSTTVLGRTLLTTLFEGGHRHGPQADLFLYFQGWFDVPTGAKYEFSIFSTDASFLLVDGKPLVAWPGRHHFDGGRQGQFRAAVDLAAGPHTLDYYNAYDYRNEGRPPIVCCLAVNVADAGWNILRNETPFFRPISRAHIAWYDLIPESLAATSGVIAPQAPLIGFESEIDGQSVIASDAVDTGFVLMRFRFYRPRPNWICTWTFDDGTTADGPRVEHLYLRPGTKQVKLTVRDGNKEFATLTLPINVHGNWTQLSTYRPQLDPKHREILLARDPATINASDFASVATLLQTYEDADGLAKFAAPMSAKINDATDADLAAFHKAAVYLASGEIRKYPESMQLWRALIARASRDNNTPPPVKQLLNQCRLLLAQLILRISDKLDDAQQFAKAVDPNLLSNDEKRILAIFWANLALARGNIDDAKKQYLALTPDPTGADARSSIRRTAKIDQANTFIEKKDFFNAERRIEEIEWDSPLDKLTSDCALARVRLYQERNDPAAALLWGKRVLPAITDPSTRAQLLFRITDLAFAQGDRDLARKTLRELLQKFPYSESTAQAKSKWPGEVDLKK